MQGGRTVAPVIIDPAANHRLKPPYKCFQLKIAAMRHLPLTQDHLHLLGCLRTDRWDETDKHFSKTVLRPTWPKSIAKKVEALFRIVAVSIVILAVHDLSL